MKEGIFRVHLGPAPCAVDLNDGSERGFYVNQDYILQKLQRPHRGINIMYCYYPLDKTWPKRAQEAYADMNVSFAWDYPYDNYFPYLGGINGNTNGEPFSCMRDIRRHGQDVILTLTCDPNVGEEHMIAIAKDLRPFGRMTLRLNHECTGDWFAYTKRATYRQIGDFFVKFHNILKEYAPNVKTLLCAGASLSPTDSRLEKEEDFLEALKTADLWSVDKYIALNWGWPYEVAEKDNHSHKLEAPEFTYEMTKKTFYRYKELNGGVEKPMSLAEMNVDGDVTGQLLQAKYVERFYNLIKNDPDRWFSAVTLYQFRDDGRLGLEATDPSNPELGIEQPLMRTYKNIIHDKFFEPEIDVKGQIRLPYILRWGGSEDAEGVSVPLEITKEPVFAEAYFDNELLDANLMLEINGRWFYKAPKVKCVDLMPAFFNYKVNRPHTVEMRIFAPPASGENNPTQGGDWDTNYYYTLKGVPEIRLRFEPVMSLND